MPETEGQVVIMGIAIDEQGEELSAEASLNLNVKAGEQPPVGGGDY
ncbi:hypothetical protein [Agarivorans litoreus]|nr:hypothetical protein [Agarivorans litoreus]